MLAALLLASFTTGCAHLYAVALPGKTVAEATTLPFSGRISAAMVSEPSALQKSRRFADTYWVVNDSGDRSRIFAVRHDGSLIQPPHVADYAGIEVLDAQNKDWESLALDDQGRLYIGDTGNNQSKRKKLTIYIIDEPDPRVATTVSVRQKWQFSYPDQQEFPAADQNFDAEALFWADGHLYLLTKHRSDTMTKLYRFVRKSTTGQVDLQLLARQEVEGMVTGADISADGQRLAILTYGAVWLFTRGQDGGFFSGSVFWRPIRAKQVEGITFTDRGLLLVNEQRELLQLDLDTSSSSWQQRTPGSDLFP